MGKDQELSLEERLIGDAGCTLLKIEEAIGALSDNGGLYKSLMGEKFETFDGHMSIISHGAQKAEGHLHDLISVFSKKSNESASAGNFYTTEATERTLERNLVHDISNHLASIMGFSELLLIDEAYEGLLGDRYKVFKKHLEIINSGAATMATQLSSLSGFYKAEEQKVEPVQASTLGDEEINYRIVHVDDDKTSRGRVYSALTSDSNILPHINGAFGHNGIKVMYEVISYGSVEEALRAIPELKEIDLLMTDREMPEQDGYSLLNELNQPDKPNQRKPKYANVRHIAMLTGGISEEEARRTIETYGIPILTKPIIKPLQLEQQIYSIISQRNNQS